jgi:tetratricopeptide (TPR) repeat protein
MADILSPAEIVDRAKSAFQTGDYSGAVQEFAEAASAFAATGDTLMSAEMKNNQAVALLKNKQAQAALEAARGTDAIFAEAGDNRRQGMALANQASALETLKNFKEAIDFYSRAGDAFEKAGEVDFRFEVMQSLGILYLRQFKIFEAITALQSGLIAVKNPTPMQRFMKKLLFFRL